jgi:hypothetical protein
MKLVITRPEHDITTKYISTWAKEIISFAQSKKIDVIDLVKEKANKNDFEGRLNKLQPRAIFLNGHGCEDCMFGHNDQVLIKAGDNHRLLQGKITYALSCSSGKKLGPRVVEDRNSAYIGYDDDFAFVSDYKYASRPLADPKAKPFMESSNQIMFSLLKGNTAQEAFEKSKNKFGEHLRNMSSSLTDPDSLQVAQCLWWDMKHQICLGDGDATINN